MISAELDKQVSEERAFLHELSNQLFITQGMGSLVLSAIENDQTLDEKNITRLKKSIVAAEKMMEMLAERRLLLHKMQGLAS